MARSSPSATCPAVSPASRSHGTNRYVSSIGTRSESTSWRFWLRPSSTSARPLASSGSASPRSTVSLASAGSVVRLCEIEKNSRPFFSFLRKIRALSPERCSPSQGFSRFYRSAQLGHEKCYTPLAVASVFSGGSRRKVRYRARYLAMHRSGRRRCLRLPLSALLPVVSEFLDATPIIARAVLAQRRVFGENFNSQERRGEPRCICSNIV